MEPNDRASRSRTRTSNSAHNAGGQVVCRLLDRELDDWRARRSQDHTTSCCAAPGITGVPRAASRTSARRGCRRFRLTTSRARSPPPARCRRAGRGSGSCRKSPAPSYLSRWDWPLERSVSPANVCSAILYDRKRFSCLRFFPPRLSFLSLGRANSLEFFSAWHPLFNRPFDFWRFFYILRLEFNCEIFAASQCSILGALKKIIVIIRTLMELF